MPSSRRKLPRKPPLLLTIAFGCGGPNLSDVYVPRPKQKNSTFGYSRKTNPHLSSSASTSTSAWEEEEGSCNWHSATTTSFSRRTSACNSDSSAAAAAPHHPPSSSKSMKGCRIRQESVAVVKESEDPYLDFHHSILQMIVEKEIYAQDDLRCLLQCLLSLNSPSNHPTIVRAFCDVWSCVFLAGGRRSTCLAGRHVEGGSGTCEAVFMDEKENGS